MRRAYLLLRCFLWYSLCVLLGELGHRMWWKVVPEPVDATSKEYNPDAARH